MDPTTDELATINSLAEAGDWPGISGLVQDTLLQALGNPTKFWDLAFISRTIWDRVFGSLKVVAEGEPAVERDLAPVQESRTEILRRVVLLRLGITPDNPGDPGIPTARVNPISMMPGSPGGTVPASGSTPRRKLKLSSIIDPTLDAEIIMIEQPIADKLYAAYKAKFGDRPAPDVDPTLDQLSALKQLVATGALPYVDMSLWGPHGLRTLRKQVYTSHQLNAGTGEWTKKELPGPSDIMSWQKAFKTFCAAMLLLEIARMRSEYMDRVRRQLSESPMWRFTAASPWSAVYAGAIREQDFWLKEVTTPATLFLARSKGGSRGDDSSDSPGRHSGTKKETKRKFTGEDKSVWDTAQNAFTLNRKGIEICQKFSANRCGNGKPQGRCPAGRSLGPHQGKDCANPGKKKKGD